MTFDSPYIRSKYKSSKIQIEYRGERLELNLLKSHAGNSGINAQKIKDHRLSD